jgi:hypothetical protein
VVSTALVAGFQKRRGTDQGPYTMSKNAALSFRDAPRPDIATMSGGTDRFIPEISASQLPADRVSDKPSGTKYKFRAQLADISALQPKPPRKDTTS